MFTKKPNHMRLTKPELAMNTLSIAPFLMFYVPCAVVLVRNVTISRARNRYPLILACFEYFSTWGWHHDVETCGPIESPFCDSVLKSYWPYYTASRDTRWRSWLRHYDTSWNVAGSIPDEVFGFFSWPNLSSCIMALGSAQPLTEMCTRNLPGG
jgi:hypothetical protein